MPAQGPCRGQSSAVSWPGPRPCRKRCERAPARCAASLAAVSRACLAIQSHAPSSFLVMIQILYRDQAPAYSHVSLSQYSRVYCDTLCPSHQALQSRYKLLYRDTVSFPTNLPSSLQYNICIATLFSTAPAIQPNPPCFNRSRYNGFLAIQLGSSPNHFMHQFFFSFFNFFFPATGKYKKNTYPIFYFYFSFFQNTQINL